MVLDTLLSDLSVFRGPLSVLRDGRVKDVQRKTSAVQTARHDGLAWLEGWDRQTAGWLGSLSG